MNDFEKRLVEERDQLEERLEKLNAFMITDGFGKIKVRQQQLLTNQAAYMTKYLTTLNLRIEDLEIDKAADANVV